jgi:GNAT superfamily N-acetyltransferase
MTPELFLVSTAADIDACFEAFSALRPHLKRQEFLPQFRRQQQQSYQIVAVKIGDEILSVAGFRFAEFLAWGKVLYIDDLSTLPAVRGRGYGSLILTWLIAHARSAGCSAVHLDTGYARHAAHKLYLKNGFRLSSHHMAQELFQL